MIIDYIFLLWGCTSAKPYHRNWSYLDLNKCLEEVKIALNGA